MKRVAAILADLHAGRDWTIHLLASPRDGSPQLKLLETCPGRHRHQGDAAPRDLRGLVLSDQDLHDVEGLADTCLDGCVLRNVDLTGASLAGTSLVRGCLDDGCSLRSAKLQMADLREACLRGVSLERADLTRADLRGADLRETILVQTHLKDAKYRIEQWWSFLPIPRRLAPTRFGGEDQDIHRLRCPSDSKLLGVIAEDNAQWRLMQSSRVLAYLWYAMANCGRSPGRLLLWAVCVWVAFGIAYAGYPLPGWLDGSWLGRGLCSMAPEMSWDGQPTPGSWLAPYYFSMVVMTTLGFGDIHPLASDCVGQFLVCCQSIIGYLFLSMFVALLVSRTQVRNV